MNLGDYFEATVDRAPAATAIVDDQVCWTYADLAWEVESVANGLSFCVRSGRLQQRVRPGVSPDSAATGFPAGHTALRRSEVRACRSRTRAARTPNACRHRSPASTDTRASTTAQRTRFRTNPGDDRRASCFGHQCRPDRRANGSPKRPSRLA